ncbi:unnamed protein product [Prunus armeniaca]
MDLILRPDPGYAVRSICRCTRVALAPVELLPPSVLRHPEGSPPISWASEKNENENAAGPMHCRNYWDFFSFFVWVPLSLGRASYGTAQTWLIYFQAL